MFCKFNQKDWQLRDVVSGFGFLDLFVEESKGDMTCVGPKLNRDSEANQTFDNAEMASAASRCQPVTDTATGDNFIKTNCFTVNSW